MIKNKDVRKTLGNEVAASLLFKRILNEKQEIEHLIVTVNDVTREIELATSLQEEKAKLKGVFIC